MASNGPITKEFFGLHVGLGNNSSFWPTIPGFVGTWRSWDTCPQWNLQQTSQGGAIDFTTGLLHGASMDGAVNAAVAAGADPILTLGNTPTWSSLSQVIGNTTTGSGNPTNQVAAYAAGTNAPPQNLNDWISYVSAVGNRYKGTVKYYEFFNEVNTTPFFSGTIGGASDSPSPSTLNYGSGSDLYNLVKAGSTTLKAIDPNIKIISPSWTGQVDGARRLGPLLRDLYNGGYIDVIGYHAYATATNPDNPTFSGSGCSQMVVMQQVRQYLSTLGIPVDFPVWNTEIGWAFVNADGTSMGTYTSGNGWKQVAEGQMQVGYLMRSFLVAAASGIQRQCWYAWDHTAMGMVEPSTVGTTAAAVVYKMCVFGWQVLQKWLIGRYVSDIMFDYANNVASVIVTDDNGFHGMILWNTTPNPFVITLPGGYKQATTLSLPSTTYPTSANQTYLSTASPLPTPLDNPIVPIPTNQFCLTEATSGMAGYNSGTYVSQVNPLPYEVVTSPSPSTAPNYATQGNYFGGFGLQTQTLSGFSTSSITLGLCPVLLTL